MLKHRNGTRIRDHEENITKYGYDEHFLQKYNLQKLVDRYSQYLKGYQTRIHGQLVVFYTHESLAEYVKSYKPRKSQTSTI